jgi:hypothetical protein
MSKAIIFAFVLSLLTSFCLACETETDKIQATEVLFQDEEFYNFACPNKPCLPSEAVANNDIIFNVVNVSHPPYKICIASPEFSTKNGYVGTFYLKDLKWELLKIDYTSGGGPRVINTFPVILSYVHVTDNITREAYIDIFEWKETSFKWFKSAHFGPMPGFDCQNVSTQVEQTICDDEDLAYLDSALSTNYKAVKSTNNDQQNKLLQSAQRAWIKKRNACETKECLTEIYIQRITQLHAVCPPVYNELSSSLSCISAIEAKTFFREITR